VDAGEAVAETVGSVFTVMDATSVFVQPLPSVPVTVYDELTTGTNPTLSVIPPDQV
jgi:hypothetical protein